jgi:WD40 repeat protein
MTELQRNPVSRHWRLVLVCGLLLAACPRPKSRAAEVQFASVGEHKLASIAQNCQLVTDFVFSPNGKRVLYAGLLANKPERAGVWVGDSFLMAVDTVLEIGFSNTNEPYFVGLDSGKAFIYYRYARPRAYELVSDVRFSNDGDRLAYLTRNGGRQSLVQDNSSSRTILNVLDYALNPVNGACAYATTDSADWFVITDRDTSDIYDWVQSMTFSAGGSSLAYAALADDDWFVIRDGKELPGFGEQTVEITDVALSADGNHLGYVVTEMDTDEDESFSYVVEDEVEGEVYLGISDLCFAPDGRDLAYVADDGDGQFVAGFGPEGDQYDEVWGIAFSPGSNHIAYVVHQDDQELVVVDRRELPSYDQVDKVAFSRDGRHAGFGAVRDEDFLWVVDQVR